MKMINKHYIQEGDELKEKEDSELLKKIDDYYISREKGKYKVDFTGIIINKNKEAILSFPKHYYKNKDELSEKDDELLYKYVISSLTKGFSGKSDVYNFPFNAYLAIKKFYNNFGFYHEENIIYKKNNANKVDWKKTIKKVKPLISKKHNLIYDTLISKQKENYDVFITDCMKYIFSYTYDLFNNLSSLNYLSSYILKYYDRKILKSNIFKNKRNLINKLKLLKNEIFKDSLIKLINSMIDFFAWMDKHEEKGSIGLVITDFNNNWESLVENYLNKQIRKRLNNNNFSLVKKTFTKSDLGIEGRVNEFELDHYYYDEISKDLFIFDSKYYRRSEFENTIYFNHKQFVYHFIIQLYLKSQNKEVNQIYNYLVLPNIDNESEEKDHFISDYSSISKEIGEVEIKELYLNVKKLIENSLK